MSSGRDWTIYQGDARDTLRTLPDGSVQCVVTSPPYFALRDYGVPGQLGLEQRPDCAGWATGEPCGECYVCRMTAVFREVRRVLRDDGVLFLNMGDSYAGGGNYRGVNSLETLSDKQRSNGGAQGLSQALGGKVPDGLKPKDLMGMPWRLAFSLQADGWWLRSDIIWAKKAPMPESVTDRPTKAHEYIFLLTKSARYYYDQEAVREPASEASLARIAQPNFANQTGGAKDYGTTGVNTSRSIRKTLEHFAENPGRNLRDVWTLSPACFNEAHFATFPPALPETCIKAGTSERGCCPECGAPWERVVEHGESVRSGGMGGNSRSSSVGPMDRGGHSQWDQGAMPMSRPVATVGWRPTCTHDADPVPCTVLDPFAGAGTTLLVANRLGRRALGIELNPSYVEMATRRIVQDAPLFNMELAL